MTYEPAELHAAFSGGLYSTAMLIGLHEYNEDFVPFYFDTGNMPQALDLHINDVEQVIGRKILRIQPPALEECIHQKSAIPNSYQQWCRDIMKVRPLGQYVLDLKEKHVNYELAFGSGAEYVSMRGRYPLREWRWNDQDCELALYRHRIRLPRFTNCMWCPRQSMTEWRELWKNQPEQYALAEKWEAEIGRTFRTPNNEEDVSLKALRERFEGGYVPRVSKYRKIGRRGCSC